MSTARSKLLLLMLGCAIAWAGGGCHAPWFGRSEPAQFGRPTAAPVVDTATPPSMDDHVPQMADVLDTMQEVGALDPAAQRELLEQLREAKPEMWPLVAERFRSSIAYREQLTARTGSKERGAGSGELAADGQAPAVSFYASAPVGTLVDPRRVRSETAAEQPRARAVEITNVLPPTEEVAAPAEFAADETAMPIMAADGRSSSQDVRRVSFEAFDEAAAKDGERGRRGEGEIRPQSIHSPSPPLPISPSLEHTELDWQQLVDQAADELGARVAASPNSTAEVHQHATLRMLRLLAGRTEEALEPIPHISPAEQDYWSRQLFALATYLDHHNQPDDKRRAAAAVIHLNEALANLREVGALSLRNLAFCKEVDDFGAFEPYDTHQFTPGQQLLLYVEVENYHSRSTEDGFCTLLGSTYELLDESGNRVDGGAFPDVEDYCRGRRRDFHIQYGLALPANLTPGRYRLQLVVKDRQCDKMGSATIDFEVKA